MPTNSPSTVAAAIGTANTAQVSQALVIQTYALSVKQQPPVDLSADPKLAHYQTQINDGLTTAQGHASNYLTNIQPAIIQNIANISNYYALNNAVPSSLPPGSTVAEWLAVLGAMQTQAGQYQAAANSVVSSLQTLTSELSSDTAVFATVVSNFNAAVNGDNGELASLDSQLSKIQGEIDGAIAGTVLSGLTIVGGGLMIAAGSVAEFITAGTSTSLVIGGVGIVAAGIGGEVASAISLKNLNDAKASLLAEESSLKTEVNLALGISNGYQSLSRQITAASTAASQMANAWSSLSDDLGSLASDLQNGILNTDALRTLFLTAANGEVATLLTAIQNINAQLAGVTTVPVPAGQTVGQALVAAAQKQAA